MDPNDERRPRQDGARDNDLTRRVTLADLDQRLDLVFPSRPIARSRWRDSRLARLGLNGAGVEALTQDQLGGLLDELEDLGGSSAQEIAPPLLEFHWVRDLAAAIATRPPRSYTFRPVWIAGKHGVMAASDKAQKSWDAADAAVSGASGTAWLGVFPCEAQGPVVIFWGEGDDEDLVLRLRAIAKSRDLELDDLPIRVCLRVPHLTDQEQLAIVRAELLATQPTLVILDPLYLAVGGARSSDLVEMGGALEAIQHLTQAVRASLLVLHHFRKGGSGTDRDRMSGAGPAAWGRVLVSIHVTSRRTEPDGASIVTRRLAFIGDAISDLTIVVRRRIRKINPDTASSPYEYEIEQLEEDELAGDEALPPSARRVLSVLDAARHSLKVREIGDQLAEAGHPLKRRTIQEALALLDKMERAKGFGDPAQGLEWVSITAETSDQPPVEEPNAF